MSVEPQLTHSPEAGPAPPELLRLIRERAQSFVGTLLWLAGEAEVRDAVTRTSHRAERGVRLSRQCALIMKEGSALVRMDDGSDLWLAAGAEVHFTPWDGARRGFRLALGRVLSLVARDRSRPFSVQAPAARILVTGTAFEADADAERLEVSILHGSVECAGAAGRVRARRGYRVSIAAEGRPEVRRLAPGDLHGAPAMLLAMSEENKKIKTVCRTVGKTLNHLHADEKGRSTMTDSGQTGGRKWLFFLLLLIAGGAGAWWWQTNQEAKPAVKEEHHVFRAGDGGEVREVRGGQSGSAGGGAQSAPPAWVTDAITSATQSGKTGSFNFTGPNGNGMVTIKRGGGDARGGRGSGTGGGSGSGGGISGKGSMGGPMGQAKKSIDDLVQSGVPLEEAIKRVEKGLQESMMAKNQATGNLPPPEVHIQYDGERQFSISVGQPGAGNQPGSNWGGATKGVN